MNQKIYQIISAIFLIIRDLLETPDLAKPKSNLQIYQLLNWRSIFRICKEQ